MADVLITSEGPVVVLAGLDDTYPKIGAERPIGSYYFSSTGVNPATELGYGTWTQVAQGQFLVGAT